MAKQKFSVEQVKTDLEIEEFLAQQDRGWKIRSFGLFFIGAMVATAALGLFGDGVLSAKTIREGDVKLDLERFYRHEARMELKLEVNNGMENWLVISFPTDYLRDFQVESILPDPKANKTQNGQVEYFFEGTGNMKITFYLIPRKIGTAHGTMQVKGETLPLNHFIFP